jgi:predicted transcriptional regulator
MKTTTVRMDDELLERVDGIAKTLNRPRSWVVTQALDRFVAYEEWFLQEVQAGLTEVQRAEIATTEELKNAFMKWHIDAG